MFLRIGRLVLLVRIEDTDETHEERRVKTGVIEEGVILVSGVARARICSKLLTGGHEEENEARRELYNLEHCDRHLYDLWYMNLQNSRSVVQIHDDMNERIEQQAPELQRLSRLTP